MDSLAWWATNAFIPEVETLRETVEKRLLPSFEGIEEEANRIEADAWHRLNEAASECADGATLAEAAQEAGVAHYLRFLDARQGLLNLFAVAAWHQFEQQAITLVRRELSGPKAMKWRACATRLRKAGVDPETFPQWEKLEELRHVANVAKHAEGSSAEELEKIRTDLFVAPVLGEGARPLPPGFRHVFQPLSGDDLFVGPDDLTAYFDAIEGFWREFAERIEART